MSIYILCNIDVPQSLKLSMQVNEDGYSESDDVQAQYWIKHFDCLGMKLWHTLCAVSVESGTHALVLPLHLLCTGCRDSDLHTYIHTPFCTLHRQLRYFNSCALRAAEIRQHAFCTMQRSVLEGTAMLRMDILCIAPHRC